MKFQKVTLIVATTILVILLIIIGIIMWQQNKKKKYPPIIGRCPDFWEMSENGDCINPHVTPGNELGNTSSDCKKLSRDFMVANKNNPSVIRDKVISCQQSWEGVTWNIPQPRK